MKGVDARTSSLLEKTYQSLRSKKSASLLKKYLTQPVFDELKTRVTRNGGTLLDVIRSGVANPDSSIGAYAPDAESYTVFGKLFDPIIIEYHEVHGSNIAHPPMKFGNPESLGDFGNYSDYVLSTRIRCARSLEGYPFNSLLTQEKYQALEKNITTALKSLTGDLAGNYRPLKSISAKDAKKLVDDHLLFQQGDRFLEAANACRFWPDGRGIYQNSDSTLLVWVNEEDHMRIISMQQGGNLSGVYDRFSRAVNALSERLKFAHSSKLGFLTFCPTNLGTAIRASVLIRLPNLQKENKILQETADRYNLQVRGSKGEHSKSEGAVFDISNKRRLGLTEKEVIIEMYSGILEIITMEKRLEHANKTRRRKR